MQQDQNLLQQLIRLNDQLKETLSRLNQQITVLEKILAAQTPKSPRRADPEQQSQDSSSVPDTNLQMLLKKRLMNRRDAIGEEKKYLKYKNKYQKLKKYM